MKVPDGLAEKYPKVIQWLNDTSGPPPPGKNFWETELIAAMEIIEAEPETLVYKLKVADHYCSRYHTAHSGFIATVIDICNYYVLGTYQGKHHWEWFGVTSDMSISFLRAIKPGKTLRFECEVQKVTKGTAHQYTKVYDDDTDDLCYTATLVKVQADYNASTDKLSKL